MALSFVSLVSLVKPHDTADPNSKITTRTLFNTQEKSRIIIVNHYQTMTKCDILITAEGIYTLNM